MDSIKFNSDSKWYVINVAGRIVQGYGRESQQGILIRYTAHDTFIPWTSITKADIYKNEVTEQIQKRSNCHE